MKRNIHCIFGIAICIFLFLGCGSNRNDGKTAIQSPLSYSPETKATGSGTMSISFKYSTLADIKGPGTAAKLAATEAISNVTAYVYKQNTGEEIVHQDLTITNGIASGIIKVPAPDTLKVAVIFYDRTVVQWAGDVSYVIIEAGLNAPVTMTAIFQGITATSTMTTPFVGKPVTINWYSTPFSSSFELWESTKTTGGNGSLIYSGAALTYNVPGKAAVGTYYYRVRAITKYGPGPFYSNGMVTVNVSAQPEGGIEISTPVPPDEPSY